MLVVILLPALFPANAVTELQLKTLVLAGITWNNGTKVKEKYFK